MKSIGVYSLQKTSHNNTPVGFCVITSFFQSCGMTQLSGYSSYFTDGNDRRVQKISLGGSSIQNLRAESMQN